MIASQVVTAGPDPRRTRTIILLLAACVAPPKKDLALERVRDELDSLKSNPELTGYAPLAVGEAERALRNAELATGDRLARAYLVYMADRRIQIARTMAEREQLEQAAAKLENDYSAMLIKASQLEAVQARMEAEQARLLVAATNEEAERARQEREEALQKEAESARAAKLAEEEAWIRQGIKARRTRNEGRVRALMKMREEVAERIVEFRASILVSAAELRGAATPVATAAPLLCTVIS